MTKLIDTDEGAKALREMLAARGELQKAYEAFVAWRNRMSQEASDHYKQLNKAATKLSKKLELASSIAEEMVDEDDFLNWSWGEIDVFEPDPDDFESALTIIDPDDLKFTDQTIARFQKLKLYEEEP